MTADGDCPFTQMFTQMRWLRPGVQVPIATACCFAAIASIVEGFGHVDDMANESAEIGAVLTGVASFVTLWALVRTREPERFRLRAVAWPPAIGALVAPVVCQLIRFTRPRLSLSIGELNLGELGVANEILVEALFGALIGLLGSAIVAPQAWLLVRERARGDGAAFDGLARRLAAIDWAAALGAAGAASLCAGGMRAPITLIGVSILGLLAQLRTGRLASKDASMPQGPYRAADG